MKWTTSLLSFTLLCWLASAIPTPEQIAVMDGVHLTDQTGEISTVIPEKPGPQVQRTGTDVVLTWVRDRVRARGSEVISYVWVRWKRSPALRIDVLCFACYDAAHMS
ncbi:hypothetical protein BDR22DRAFT_977549 [Usnea florida]